MLRRYDLLLMNSGVLACGHGLHGIIAEDDGDRARPLADISAWPLLVVPYQSGLEGFDDFKAFPNIMRWIEDIKPLLPSTEDRPWFVPEDIDPLPI